VGTREFHKVPEGRHVVPDITELHYHKRNPARRDTDHHFLYVSDLRYFPVPSAVGRDEAAKHSVQSIAE
jgi:hypothetical protein